MISADPITPKFERINPGEGLRRLFSTRQLIELAKMLVKMGLLMGMLLVYLSQAVDPLAKAVYSSAPSLLSIGATLAWRLMGWAAAIYVIGAVLDYAHQYYEFIKRQRMSIEELRRDLRETEGDPLIKHRRRVIGRELVFGALKNRISSASVVVVNPTHVSVALHYLPGRAELPRVIAKGVDGLALQIRTQAELEGVPILEDPPLARKLFREVGLDHYISVNQADQIGCIDLASQPGDVHVDDVIKWSRPSNILPDVTRQHLARHWRARMTHQIFEQIEFARGQIDSLSASLDSTGQQVDVQVFDVQTQQGVRPTSPQERLYACQQFGHRKRLDQIVVGTGRQSLHTIVDPVARG
jgi:type III secretion system FlhB-like substrate exporter